MIEVVAGLQLFDAERETRHSYAHHCPDQAAEVITVSVRGPRAQERTGDSVHRHAEQIKWLHRASRHQGLWLDVTDDVPQAQWSRSG